MNLVVVRKVLSTGPQGGAIFSGITEDGSSHRFIAAWNVMSRAPIPGESWLIEGQLQVHPEFGPQFETHKATLQRPSGRLIIAMMTMSPHFPGIGETKARQLWDQFGEALYYHLDTGVSEPFVDVIGSQLTEVLMHGWQELSLETTVYAWLDRHGAPFWLAQKLIDIYGSAVVEKMEDNPYRLLAFTNWRTADTLARSIKIALDDERRLVAAVDACVYRRLQSAHTWASWVDFKNGIKELLKCSEETARKAIALAFDENAIVSTGEGIQGLGPASMERFIAISLHAMLAGQFEAPQMSMRQQPDAEFLELFFEEFYRRHDFRLNPEQQKAVRLAFSSPVGIIRGGAGVGKTTVLKALLEASEPLGITVYMMALSGRAARRMTETTNQPALTIASFLKQAAAGLIDLDCEPTIVIDEASMLDLPTMYRLLRCLEPGCKLLLLGDHGQLPPIGFGVVFHALVEYETIPQVELTEIHRHGADTGIPEISKAIRAGTVPELWEYFGKGLGVSFIDCHKAMIQDTVLDIVHELGGVGSAQAISPLKSGDVGTISINNLFQGLLPVVRERFYEFSVGEPVIWLVNNYTLGLMNGSMGIVKNIEENGIMVAWDEGDILIEEGMIDNMALAYAITVHKGQGSQWERVVIPVFESRLLDRTLLYTAITRAQYQVVLVGDRRAFERAIIDPPSAASRETGIRWWLQNAESEGHHDNRLS